MASTAGYIYLPVPSPEMLDFAHKWIEGRNRKGKGTPYKVLYHSVVGGAAKVALRKAGFGLLRNLKVTEKLYVLCHGTSNMPAIIASKNPVKHVVGGVTSWVDGNLMKQYNGAQLAQLLKDEGLPLNFIDLRIFACYSGVQFPHCARSLIDELEQHLIGFRYRSLQIKGYTGEVRAGYANRLDPGYQVPGSTKKYGDLTPTPHKGVEIVGGDIYPASTRRVPR